MGKITGKPDQFDGKNPWVSGSICPFIPIQWSKHKVFIFHFFIYGAPKVVAVVPHGIPDAASRWVALAIPVGVSVCAVYAACPETFFILVVYFIAHTGTGWYGMMGTSYNNLYVYTYIYIIYIYLYDIWIYIIIYIWWDWRDGGGWKPDIIFGASWPDPQPQVFLPRSWRASQKKPSISEYYLRCRDEMTAWDHLHRTLQLQFSVDHWRHELLHEICLVAVQSGWGAQGHAYGISFDFDPAVCRFPGFRCLLALWPHCWWRLCSEETEPHRPISNEVVWLCATLPLCSQWSIMVLNQLSI